LSSVTAKFANAAFFQALVANLLMLLRFGAEPVQSSRHVFHFATSPADRPYFVLWLSHLKDAFSAFSESMVARIAAKLNGCPNPGQRVVETAQSSGREQMAQSPMPTEGPARDESQPSLIAKVHDYGPGGGGFFQGLGAEDVSRRQALTRKRCKNR
jgi:hypothetical protein